jgi:hypothetical protein
VVLLVANTVHAQVRATLAGSAEHRRKIAEQKARLASHSKAAGELLISGMKVGDRGRPTWIDAKVMQVVNDKSMLVGIEDARIGKGRYRTWIMVKCSTKGITDGKF